MLELSMIYIFFFFFFNDTATTEIYTLSLHDALPISSLRPSVVSVRQEIAWVLPHEKVHGILVHPGVSQRRYEGAQDRKSTRLNSSHANISYAVFCLKKKKQKIKATHRRSYQI